MRMDELMPYGRPTDTDDISTADLIAVLVVTCAYYVMFIGAGIGIGWLLWAR